MLSVRIGYLVPGGRQKGRELAVVESVDLRIIACAAEMILTRYKAGAEQADDAVIASLVRCTAAQARSMLRAAGLPVEQKGEVD